MNMRDDRLWIIVPCYNEEEVLPLTAPLFLQELNTGIKPGISSAVFPSRMSISAAFRKAGTAATRMRFSPG